MRAGSSRPQGLAPNQPQLPLPRGWAAALKQMRELVYEIALKGSS
jgi:hypothetical protein